MKIISKYDENKQIYYDINIQYLFDLLNNAVPQNEIEKNTIAQIIAWLPNIESIHIYSSNINCKSSNLCLEFNDNKVIQFETSINIEHILLKAAKYGLTFSVKNIKL